MHVTLQTIHHRKCTFKHYVLLISSLLQLHALPPCIIQRKMLRSKVNERAIRFLTSRESDRISYWSRKNRRALLSQFSIVCILTITQELLRRHQSRSLLKQPWPQVVWLSRESEDSLQQFNFKFLSGISVTNSLLSPPANISSLFP